MSYLLRSRRARSILAASPSRKAGSFLLLSICSAIAARMISEIGRSSTLATVSKASACSGDRRIVIAFGAFMRNIMVSIHRTCQDNWYHDTLIPSAIPDGG